MNTNPILLTYASRYGSTQEVAGTITATLRQEGLDVDLQPMREVKTLNSYAAVVLGAAIYNTRLHPDVHIFLAEHADVLRQLPVALFILGPLGNSLGAMQNSRRQLDRDLARYPWLKLVSIEVFVGKYDPAKLGFWGKLSPASDNRDWEAIRSWANELAVQFQPV